MKKSEIAWMAGFFEGEGSVIISAPNGRHFGFLLVQICNCERDSVEIFEQVYGGSIKHRKAEGNSRENFNWCIAANKAAEFLSDVQPFLKTRKYQAKVELALEYQAQKKRPTKIERDGYLKTQQSFRNRMLGLGMVYSNA